MSSSFVTDGSDIERFVCLVYLPDPAHQLHVSLVHAYDLVDTIYCLFNHFLPLSLYPHRVPATPSKRETYPCVCFYLILVFGCITSHMCWFNSVVPTTPSPSKSTWYVTSTLLFYCSSYFLIGALKGAWSRLWILTWKASLCWDELISNLRWKCHW